MLIFFIIFFELSNFKNTLYGLFIMSCGHTLYLFDFLRIQKLIQTTNNILKYKLGEE